MIQILPDDLTEMRRHSVMLVAHLHCFCRRTFLRVLEVCLQNVGINITCQLLQENVRTNELVTNELVTNDTTPHVYGKEMLVIAFDSSMWIIMIP